MNMPPLSPGRTVYLAVLSHIVALMESGLAEPCSGIIPAPSWEANLLYTQHVLLCVQDSLAGLQERGRMVQSGTYLEAWNNSLRRLPLC
jgi:hypothetical protein